MVWRVEVRHHRTVKHSQPVEAHVTVGGPALLDGSHSSSPTRLGARTHGPALNPAYTNRSAANPSITSSSTPERAKAMRRVKTLPPRTQRKSGLPNTSRAESGRQLAEIEVCCAESNAVEALDLAGRIDPTTFFVQPSSAFMITQPRFSPLTSPARS